MQKLFLIKKKSPYWGLLFAILFCGTLQAQSPQESVFLTNVRQLIYEGKRSGEGYFSADGKKLIFQSEREADNPFYQIYLLDFETGDTRRVSPGVGKTTCSFIRPNADEVLFGSTHLDPKAVEKQKAEIEFRNSGKKRRYAWDYDENMDIFACKQDGSGLRRLTTADGYDAEGAYSPDGNKIVFSSLRAGYVGKVSPEDLKRREADPAFFGEIYIMNADGSDQKRLTEWPGYDGGPFFSPDGKRIIWRHFNEEGTVADVYTMNLDGTDKRRLTEFNSMSWAPYLHASGQYAIFTSNKFGFDNFELFIVDAEGKKEPVRVSFTNGFDGLPVFSPDGKRLAWATGRTTDGKSQIFIGDWNHAAALAALEQAPPRGKDVPLPVSAVHSDHDHAAHDKITPQLHATAFPASAISKEELKEKIEFLASEKLEGRLTGSKGAQKAAAYIASAFEKLGLEKPRAQSGYLTPFSYTAGLETPEETNALALIANGKETRLKFKKDFCPLGLSGNGALDGEVVFAGYGLKAPGDDKDGYGALDVKNKVVLVLDGVPQDVTPDRKRLLNRYADLRYKAMLARERGAKALLVYSPQSEIPLKITNDRSLSGSGLPAVSLGKKAFETLWAAGGKSWKDVWAMLNVENTDSTAFAFKNASVKGEATLIRVEGRDQNVIAVIPPAKGADYILIGAHYDHLGHGEVGSLAHHGEEKGISRGADDNASGTATIIELAEYFAGLKQKNPELFQKGIIFATWSGEEIGLVGSTYFVEHTPFPIRSIKTCLNFDMVGRMTDNKLYLQGVGSAHAWPKMIEKRNVASGFNLTLQSDPYLPTDATSFYLKNVPILNFFTGMHEDYHRPTDVPEKINYEDLTRITNFARLIVEDLIKTSDTLDFVKVENTPSMRRASASVYVGTIPDYTAEAEGLKLSGVKAGGPAEKAGIKGGDVIIEFAGQKIKNIYDYTYALDGLTVGKPVTAVVVRDGNQITFTVTPEARK